MPCSYNRRFQGTKQAGASLSFNKGNHYLYDSPHLSAHSFSALFHRFHGCRFSAFNRNCRTVSTTPTLPKRCPRIVNSPPGAVLRGGCPPHEGGNKYLYFI